MMLKSQAFVESCKFLHKMLGNYEDEVIAIRTYHLSGTGLEVIRKAVGDDPENPVLYVTPEGETIRLHGQHIYLRERVASLLRRVANGVEVNCRCPDFHIGGEEV